MVGQDGKTMYKVVEITMRGKPVKKWAKMKFKMGQGCSRDDTGECDSGNPKIAAQIEKEKIAAQIEKEKIAAQIEKEKIAEHSMLEENIKAAKEARVKLEESIVVAKKVVRDTKTQKKEIEGRLLKAVKANKHKITQRGLAIQKISIDNLLESYEKISEGLEVRLDQLNKTITAMEKGKDKLGEELLGGDHGARRRRGRGRRGRRGRR
jgi:hypothetical protein